MTLRPVEQQDDTVQSKLHKVIGSLGMAPRMSDLYGTKDLEADSRRELISIATLPTWPNAQHPHGHGWGETLNRMLGGGICQGYFLAVGAASAGAGKTAFVMQLADGLALRTAELVRENKPGPLTPVLILSEMGAPQLTWRSLARWTGADSRIFRAGRSAASVLGHAGSEEEVDIAFRKASAALEGDLGASRQFIRCAVGLDAEGATLASKASEIAKDWTAELKAEHPKREVWPVVVIDPIQRWQGTGNEVEALNELVEAIGKEVISSNLIVIATSDTNKATGTGSTSGQGSQSQPERAAAVFRGSYKLHHLADAVIALDASDEVVGTGKRKQQVIFAKNRWGSIFNKDPIRYDWEMKTGRFT
jgi:hypothetical protein